VPFVVGLNMIGLSAYGLSIQDEGPQSAEMVSAASLYGVPLLYLGLMVGGALVAWAWVQASRARNGGSPQRSEDA
jgi:hypothetical protein